MSSTVLATVVITSCSKEQDMIQTTASSAPSKESTTKTATAPTAGTSTGNLKSFSTYDNWSVVFELQNASNAVVWSGTSTRVLRLFLPAATGATTTDNFTLTNTAPAGSYKLVVSVKDPANYRPNIWLAINGRNTYGSYTLLEKVLVR